MNIFQKIAADSNLDELLEFVTFFWYINGYSVRNSILIFAQRPGAMMLGTEAQWKQWDRSIKPEAHPIVILKPFGPLAFIYEYADTIGEKELFPERITFSKDIPIHPAWMPDMIAALRENGIYYGEKHFGSAQGGELRIGRDIMTYTVPRKRMEPKKITTDCVILVNADSDDTAKFKSILHELGHLFCGHLKRGAYTPEKLRFPKNRYQRLSPESMEYEAELTVEMVCKILGLKHDATHYLAGYRLHDGTRPHINFDAVSAAADRILAILPPMIQIDTLNIHLTAYGQSAQTAKETEDVPF